jgi:aspartate/methionine/tyrosine aminotransferase
MNPQATELNSIISSKSPAISRMLSEKGKEIFFPKSGIMAQSIQAKGKKFNATIGIALEEDGSPMRLASIAEKIDLIPSQVFPYSTSFGNLELRKNWKKLMLEKNPGLKGREISLPVITNALTHGLSIAGYLFIDQGQEVILPEYFWGNYRLIFVNQHGAEIKTFEMYKDGGFNVEAFAETLKGGKSKKIVCLNFPNNPTGYTPSQEDMQSIVAEIKKSAEAGNDILVLIDDAYFGLVYENGIEKQSIFSYLTDLHENVLAVKIDGATKEDYVWGFRVGFITFGIKNGTPELYDALVNKTGGAIRGNISNVSNLSQSLVNTAFESSTYKTEKKEKFNLLNRRYEMVKKVLTEKPEYAEYFEALPYNSGYFMCIKLKKGLDGNDVRMQLLEKYDTGTISMNDIVRVAYSALPTDSIPTLFSNIYSACRDLV